MATFRTHIELTTPVDEVWRLISDPGGVSSWFPLVRESVAEGNRRHLVLQDGTRVVEDVITVDSDRRRFQYQIVDGLPIEHHLSTVDVIETAAGSALVVYSVELEPATLANVLGPAVEEAVQNLPTVLAC